MNTQKKRDNFSPAPGISESKYYNPNLYYPPQYPQHSFKQQPQYTNNPVPSYHPDFVDEYSLAPIRKEVCKLNPSHQYDLQIPSSNSNIEDVVLDSTKKTSYNESPSEMAYFREHISTQAARSRSIFYDFLKKAGLKASYAESFFNEVKKNLNFKVARALNPSALMTSYEKMLQKSLTNPRYSKKNWNEEEFLFLASIITYYCVIYDFDCGALGNDSWEYLASLYPGKKADQLKKKWQNTYKVHLSKVPWSKTEDDILIQVIKEKGAEQHWREIAITLNKRTNSKVYRHAKQCRERWINHLDPSKNRGAWTDQEDTNLLRLYLEKGRKWSEIAKQFGDRTENSVKNRWNSMLKKYKTEVNIEPCPKGDSVEEAIAWERKIATLLLDAKKNGLCTGPQYSTSLKNSKSQTESSEHDYSKKYPTTDSEHEFSDNLHKGEVSWEIKSPKTLRIPSANEKNTLNNLFGNFGLSEGIKNQAAPSNMNLIPPDSFENPNQSSYLPKEEIKPFQENPIVDIPDPTLLKQQDPLAQAPTLEQNNPANLYNIYDKGSQNIENIFPYGLENEPVNPQKMNASFEMRPNLQPIPQVSMQLSDIDLENLLGRVKTQSSDIPPDQIQYKTNPQIKKRELSDSDFSVYQEIFGSKEAFNNPNNSKNKEELIEKELNPPIKRESTDSIMRMLNLDHHPTS